MSFVPIATKCNGPLEAAHVSIDDDRYDVADLNVALPPAGPRGPSSSSQISYDVVESLLRKLSSCAER